MGIKLCRLVGIGRTDNDRILTCTCSNERDDGLMDTSNEAW